MVKLRKLAEALLKEKKSVTLSFEKYNDGTEEEPDILIDRVTAGIQVSPQGCKDIVVYLLKEGKKAIYDTFEIYRMPLITNLDLLEKVLEEVRKQSHLL